MNSNLHQAQSHEILRSWQSQRNDINHHKDFVLPLFIGNDDDLVEAIDSMPEVYRYGCNKAIEYLEPLVYSFGLRSVLLFPVVNKTDKEQLNQSSDIIVDNEIDDDNKEILSGSSSSGSQYSLDSSSSSNEDEEHRESNVMDERLLLPPIDSEDCTNNNSQNPFLNQEEVDNLLNTDRNNKGPSQEDASQVSNRLKTAPMPPPRANETLRKISTTQDVKLIKGMALKDKYNPVLRLIPKLRAKFPQLLIICDVCLCAFTSTGHCCLFEDHSRANNSKQSTSFNLNNLNNYFPISNKVSCQYLAMLSVEYALRGCNVIAPSDMMDGRILTIREKLNEHRLFQVSIMSYSAKFASAFYGPFRQATENAPEFGDRRAYQLPPGSRALALKAVERDIAQGADFVMVKPGLAYLDIVRDTAEAHPHVPVAVYQVSGEYSMLKIAAKANVFDLKRAVAETLTAFRRAGATIIISYFTPEILKGELISSDIN